MDVLTHTKTVPPVCNLSGFNTTLWTIKFGKRATGGTSVTAATFQDHLKTETPNITRVWNMTQQEKEFQKEQR